MKSKISNLVFVILFLSVFSYAQTSVYAFVESPLEMTSNDSTGKAMYFYTAKSTLILNPATVEFTLRANLSNLKCSKQEIDTLIDRRANQMLIFTGQLMESISIFNQQINDGNSYDLPGKLSFHAVSLPLVANYSAISLAERSDSKNYRMNFRLNIKPGFLLITGLENILKNEVAIEISGGMLNIQN